MEGDFEAGAKLRQQLRGVRRAEKKAAEEAATKAAANAEQGCEPLPYCNLDSKILNQRCKKFVTYFVRSSFSQNFQTLIT